MSDYITKKEKTNWITKKEKPTEWITKKKKFDQRITGITKWIRLKIN